MNWGLFLALTSFLVPLSFAIRLAVNAVGGRSEASAALQWLRGAQMLLVGGLICGKLPAVLYASVGREARLGHITEAFMVTPWGFAQLTFILAAVAVCEWSAPAVIAQLEGHPGKAPARAVYLRRHGLVVAICLLLAGFGAR